MPVVERFWAMLLKDFGINFGAFLDTFRSIMERRCRTGAYVIFDECFERFAWFYDVRGLKNDSKHV